MNTLVAVLLFASAASAAHLRPYIVGGRDVPYPGKHPWQGSLQQNGAHACGASLISPNWAVTAAHCADSTFGLSVVFGMHDRVVMREGRPQRVGVQRVIRHPLYSQDGPSGFPNDISVLELAFAADINDNVQPAIMATPEGSNFAGAECMITGWGQESGTSGILPNILREADVDILTEEACQEFWGMRIQGYHICLGDLVDGSKGACNGDSGGPLVCKATPSDPWTLAGITSWGTAGCDTSLPSVYVRVSYFREWVRGITGV